MHELVKRYQKIGGPSSNAIKMDIVKAFDTVNWNYLMKILKSLNFPDRFINWVHLYIRTAFFSINLNGSLIGNFKAIKGLKQGDLLSLYLFILVMEGFTQILKANIDAS